MKIKMLSEQALKRGEVIATCMSLADEFIEHFHKVVKLGVNDVNFKHHCNEMQTWWDKARRIKLKNNKKQISTKELCDWFLTQGSDVESIIEEPYQAFYKIFCKKLIDNPDKKIYDILYEL